MATTEEGDVPPAVVELAGAFDARTRDLLDELTAGESHTTFLREATGMNRQTVHRRLDDLEERGLIETETRAPDSGGQPRRHAVLTEYGEQMIDDGLLDTIHDTNKNLLALEQRITKIHSELEKEIERQPGRAAVKRMVSGEVDQRIGSMERQVENLEEKVDKYERWISDARKAAGKVDDRLSSRIDGVERTAEVARDEARNQGRELDRLEARVEALEERERARAGAILAHIRGLFDAIDELEEQVAAVESEQRERADQAEEAIADVRGGVDAVRQSIDTLEETARNLYGFKTEAESRLDDLEAAEGDSETLRQRVESLEEDLETLQESQSRGLFG